MIVLWQRNAIVADVSASCGRKPQGGNPVLLQTGAESSGKSRFPQVVEQTRHRLESNPYGDDVVTTKVAAFKPATAAVTWIMPALLGVVYRVLAWPETSVVADGLEKIPPLPPSLKATATPGIGFEYASITVTVSGKDKGVFAGAA